MPNAYTAGAVTAKITLDTKLFVTSIDDLISRVEVLKQNLNEVGSFNDISKKVKELEKELSTSKDTFTKLNEKIADYKKQMSTLREENANLQKQIKELNETLKTNQTTLDNTAKSRKSNVEAIKSESKVHSDNIKLISEEIAVNKKLNGTVKQLQGKKATQVYGQLYNTLDASRTVAGGTKLTTARTSIEHLRSMLKGVAGDTQTADAAISRALDHIGAKIIGLNRNGEIMVEFTLTEKKSFMELAKSTNMASNSISKLTSEENKAVTETTKLNKEISKLDNNKSVEKTTKAISKLNTEQRKAGLEAKRNARIYDNMRLEAYNYINGLKRGRNAKGVIGTDTALWANFKGVSGRTRTFDMDRFTEHMKKSFEGAVPNDVFDDMFRKLTRMYKIGWVGWLGDRGGIPEDKLDDLRVSAEVIEDKISKRRGIQSKIDEYLGLDPNRLRDWNIEKAAQAFNSFERQLKTTTVDYEKLEKVMQQKSELTSITTASQALATFDRMLKTTIVDYEKLIQLFNLHNAGKALDTFNRGLKSTPIDLEQLKYKDAFYNSFEKDAVEIENALNKIAGFKTTGLTSATREWLKEWADAAIVVKRSVEEITQALSKLTNAEKYIPKGADLANSNIETATQAFSTLERRVKSTEVNVEGFNQIYEAMGATFSTNNVNINAAKNVLKLFDGGVEKSQARLKAYAEQTKATFETMQVELAKASAAQYKYWKQIRGMSGKSATPTWYTGDPEKNPWKQVEGWNAETLNIGINQYYGQIDEINAKLAEFKRQQQSVNDSINQSYNAFVKASDGIALFNNQMDKFTASQQKNTTTNGRLTQQISRLKTQMSSLRGSSEIAKKAFASESQQATMLGNRLKILSNQFRTGKISSDQYANELNKLEKEYSELHTKIQLITRDLQQGNLIIDKNGKLVNKNSAEYNKMSQGMTKSAHSGRILSNTLYQIRGALLSVKMIFTAMGGMALWGFATDLAEGVKETFTAKNEMEAQLRQNAKVDRGGIEYFNQQLDEMTKKFKKINKYSIGETVSAIGLEFELNAKQMAESLDIVSMIQSEYVRAGRKEDEAALAVKDILQGEFQRLSRETGVGKEELEAYGWNGDKKDVESLLKALRKAALDRNWDLFAAKATSLNDVLTITKSRFSETGADLMQTATPMIVGAFNAIIDTIDGLQNAFNNMSSFWQNFTTVGGATVIFGGLLTALPMVSKGMGLADIATIGWGKSVLTAALNLNKATVAQYGFKKALAEVITGQKASELANIRWSKAIMGRILGVDQATLKEKGYLSSLIASRAALKGSTDAEMLAGATSLTRSQKLAVLTRGIDANTAKEYSRGKALLKTATSWKVLRMAILGVTTIALVAWFSSVSEWCKKTKEDVDGFHRVVSQGGDLLKDAKKSVDDYETSLEKLTKGTDKYKRASANLDIAKGTVEDLEKANKLAKQYDYNIKQYGQSIVDRKKQRAVDSLTRTGLDYSTATEKASAYADQVERGYKAELQAYVVEDTRLYRGTQHINERLAQMEKEGVALEDRVDYANEYRLAVEGAAEHWKQFYKGNFNAGLYAILDELKTYWIDLWNNESFINFWAAVNKTWKELQPTANAIKDALIGIGEALLNFFSTDQGRWIGTIGLIGGGIGLIGAKIGKWITGSDSVYQVLKKVGGKLKDVATGWKDVGDKAEETIEKTGGDTSTGGVLGETDGKGTSLGGDLKNIGKTRLKSFVNNALIIAEGMALVTEAILLLEAPMRSLAFVGSDFKTMETDIRNGIEGLQLVSPVVGAILVPILAIHFILSKYGKFMNTWDDLKGNLKAFATMIIGIAEGMVLVTEAIGLLILPMSALAGLGMVKAQLGDSVEKGIEAIKVVSEALYALVPWIPVFIGGIALAATIFLAPELALPALATAAIGIATGVALVTEAILTLHMPLTAIESIGQRYPNLDGVRQGAEALKLTAEALKYVGEAMASLALVDIALLAQNISHVVGTWFGIDLGTSLNDLTAEGGVLDQLSQFVNKFNSDEFTIETVDQGKVSALATAGDGVKTIGDAMVKVKTAMDNLPEEFKNPKTNITYNQETNETKIATEDTTGYFDTFKEPIKQLKSFVYDFNHNEEFNIEEVKTERISAITNAANMITQINTAVEQVKTAMGNIGDAQWNTSYAQGGIFGAVGNFLIHQTGIGAMNNGSGSGSYKSSLGSSLQAMEDVISDMFTFQSKISQYGGEGGEGTDVSGLTSLVTMVQDAISQLSTNLSNAVPTLKQNGKSLGNAVVNGVKEGITGMTNIGSSIPPKIANGIMNNKEMVYNTANSLGKTTAKRFKTGVDPMSEYMTWEMSYVNKAMIDRKDELGQTAYNVGSYIAQKFKEGDDINSPGLMARAMQGEMGYIGDALTVNNLPQLAYDLGNSLSSNFKLDFGLSNIQLPNVSNFTNQLSVIPSTVNDVKTKVTTDFTNIKNNVGGAFTNIVSKTRTNMSSMYSTTTKHIGNIKTSWKGMQTALVASAETIRTQTKSKIDKIKTNLGDFWGKIKNPDRLIAGGNAGGKPTGTIRRGASIRTPSIRGSVAGSPIFKPRISHNDPSDYEKEGLLCQLLTGSPCYSGGWDYNWSPKISKKMKSWRTHFNQFNLDKHVKVGSFENSNFPVKGNVDVFKDYVEAVIKATTYDYYYDSRYSPAEALRRGSFNCWDGTQVILALARAFGIGGGGIGHGTWGSDGHVWATIPGIGVIDPTAIQRGYGFKSPKVKGYGAGSPSRSSSVPKGDTHNEVHIHIEGDVYGVDDLNKKIEDGANRVARKLFTNRLSGV